MTDFRRVVDIFSNPIERQVTEYDCAVWAIKAMCFQLKVTVPPAKKVRQLIDLDNVGTSIRGVRDALEELGISAQPVQGPNDAIASAPLPAIAMVRLNRTTFHYVVVLTADHRTVKYLDPAIGGPALTRRAEDFSSIFTGNLVLCERKADYAAIDLGKEVEPGKFILGAVAHEWNAAVALAISETFQLLMLLLGILMLKNFFASSVLGVPNLWFLGGIALCAAIYIWIGKLQEMIRADIKSRSLLGLLGFATGLIKKSNIDPKQGLRETSARCVKVVSAVATSLTNNVRLPGNTLNMVLYISLVAWFDFYAACYAIGIALILPTIGLWQATRTRTTRRAVNKSKDRNQMGLVYLMAKAGDEDDFVSDLPWNQVEYCDAVTKHDRCVSFESVLSTAIGRINVFAALLIGGLQHATLGMGHTVVLFFLLSIYTTVVCRWARQLASIPESRFQVRAMLDFLSDLTAESLNYGIASGTTPIPESRFCLSQGDNQDASMLGSGEAI